MAVRRVTKTSMAAVPLAAALLSAAVLSAAGGEARATPSGCGPGDHPPTCPPYSGLQTSGETAFLNSVRGRRIPGDDTRLLAAGRGICRMLLGGETVNDVIPQVAAELGLTTELAGNVVDTATAFVCPGAPLNV